MAILKQIIGDELFLYMNGSLIYKKWLSTGEAKVFDIMAYDKYTLRSITDFEVSASPEVIQFEARLRLLTPEEGGRQTGIKSKYRSNHVFEYHNDKILRTFIGEIIFDDKKEIMPGEEAMVRVRFLLGQPIDHYFDVGRKWWIHEGAKKVGEAEILKVG